MIVLLTDFGVRDPYIGQLQAAILRLAPGTDIINLFPELPSFAIRQSAYLLAAYQHQFPVNTVFTCVVDPGVGTTREPVIIKAQGKWFVGPDNGIFDIVKKHQDEPEQWRIDYRPDHCSDTFHGRDIFAPVSAQLSQGKMPAVTPLTADPVNRDWPDDLKEIVYCDHYGNAMTGIRSSVVSEKDLIEIASRKLAYCRTFAEADGDEPFWYRNSNGLVEIAQNQASVVDGLGLKVGDGLRWLNTS